MIRVIVILLCLCVGVSELHSFAGRLWPDVMLTDASGWFVNKLPDNYITAGWWLYEMEGLFNRFVLCSIIVILAKNYSRKVYYAALLFLAHAVFGAVMFVCYYKKSAELFWVTGLLFGLLVAVIFIKEKKQAVIKSIQ